MIVLKSREIKKLKELVSVLIDKVHVLEKQSECFHRRTKIVENLSGWSFTAGSELCVDCDKRIRDYATREEYLQEIVFHANRKAETARKEIKALNEDEKEKA